MQNLNELKWNFGSKKRNKKRKVGEKYWVELRKKNEIKNNRSPSNFIQSEWLGGFRNPIEYLTFPIPIKFYFKFYFSTRNQQRISSDWWCFEQKN